MESIDVPLLVHRLSSPEDSVRKMAVFKLQSAVGDPSFADVFIIEGGLPKLRSMALNANGNTLAYALTTFSRLLELDMGWEGVDDKIIERAVELVVTQPLVNILRGAMSMLVAIVSHPASRDAEWAGAYGFRALKPAIAVHPTFLEMLVARLSSADHALCANALQLINALMRDSLLNDADHTWPKFIKRLQDLGVIKSVHQLMQSSAWQDLALPLLEFQYLTKVLLRKWRDVKADGEKPEHRRALKGLQLASTPTSGQHEKEEPIKPGSAGGSVGGSAGGSITAKDKEKDGQKDKTGVHPDKWRRLGFETENPVWEFDETGFLGFMDLTDFVRKNEDGYQNLLLEQSTKPEAHRCPIARASLAVTLILYEHFEIDKAVSEDFHTSLQLETRTNYEKAFKPLLLQWSRLHTAGLNAFVRLWKETSAEIEDIPKVEELVRILIEQVVGSASRLKNISEVEQEMLDFSCSNLRRLQMELVELTYEDAWGHHLRQVRDELQHEALQFIKEQRIRCLLAGAWFPQTLAYADGSSGPITKANLQRNLPIAWRFVRLSHNRRYLHYADFDSKTESTPELEALTEKIDLGIVSSVVSNVSASAAIDSESSLADESDAGTIRSLPAVEKTTTKITIHGFLPSKHPSTPHSQQSSSRSSEQKETPLLHLHPQTHTLAAEWLDGLLMLLNQAPITADTNKLVELIAGYGLKIRLLNVRFDELPPGWEDGDGGHMEMPGREGVEDDFFYEIGGM